MRGMKQTRYTSQLAGIDGSILLKDIVDSLGYGDSTRNELLSSGILGSMICVAIIMIVRKRRHDIENQENK